MCVCWTRRGGSAILRSVTDNVDALQPAYEDALTEWLTQVGAQLDGAMRVLGVTDGSARKSIVEAHLKTLTGSLTPSVAPIAVAMNESVEPVEYNAVLSFATAAGTVLEDDGVCDYRHCASVAMSRLA
jgi:hypothetical protein